MTDTTKPVPQHLLPENCFVCGKSEHRFNGGHKFWSNAEADAYFRREAARHPAATKSMSAVETLDPREAVYR